MGFVQERGIPGKARTPIKAIRDKCLDCTCGQIKAVRECMIQACPLWPYRMGRRPAREDKAEESKEG